MARLLSLYYRCENEGFSHTANGASTNMALAMENFNCAVCPVAINATVVAAIKRRDIAEEIFFYGLAKPKHIREYIKMLCVSAWQNYGTDASETIQFVLNGAFASAICRTTPSICLVTSNSVVTVIKCDGFSCSLDYTRVQCKVSRYLAD